MASALLIGAFLAFIFYAWQSARARRNDESDRRGLLILVIGTIAIAVALLAATQLGFIPDHAP